MESVFRANAFQPGHGSRTISGKLFLTPGTLRFEFESGHVELPLAGLRVRIGGNNSEQVFFEHPLHPDWSIYTPDLRILDLDGLKQDAALAKQLRTLRRRGGLGKPLALVGAVVGLFLILIAVAVSNKGRLVRYLAFQVPVAWEINLGNSLFEQVKREGKILSDADLDAQLRAVTSRLLLSLTNAGFNFQFHILDDTNVNAFAMPGGHVVVLSGLLKASERPEEIAGVLAHEIAHVTQRHGFRKIIDTAGLFLIVQSLFGDASGLTAVLANGSEFLLRQKYSRDFEREADDVGWECLLAANIDPRGLTDFFRKLRAREEAGFTVPGLLSTHPATEERIKRLEAKWESMNRPSGFIRF